MVLKTVYGTDALDAQIDELNKKSNKSEHPTEVGPCEKPGQKTAEISGDFFNRIALK